MNKKLNFTQNFFIGSMLFGMFFGAGNLIFPVHMGQEAGAGTLLAAVGFIITATGLPLLGVLAMGISGENGMLGLAGKAGKKWGYLFAVLLYMTIGPLFASPRTGTVSFEVGLAPFIDKDYQRLGLFLFTLVFFAAALFFALRPGKLLMWIGKVLNPIFLVLLGILIISAFIKPMGNVGTAETIGAYQSNPLMKGFTEGYNTMDALASLAFGILVVNALKDLGVNKPKEIVKSTAKAGMVSALLMVVIYGSLAYIGATSTHRFAVSENGGIALWQIAHYYFGGFGSVLLAVLVTIACLKTAIGLATSCAEAFSSMFPRSFSYRTYVVIFTVVSFAVANVGLTQIIALSLPILMFLYPQAIVLIVLTIIGKLFDYNKMVYRVAIAAATVFSFGDALKAAPAFFGNLPPIRALLRLYQRVPLFDIGMGWLIPAALVGIVGVVLYRFRRRKNINKVSIN